MFFKDAVLCMLMSPIFAMPCFAQMIVEDPNLAAIASTKLTKELVHFSEQSSHWARELKAMNEIAVTARQKALWIKNNYKRLKAADFGAYWQAHEPTFKKLDEQAVKVAQQAISTKQSFETVGQLRQQVLAARGNVVLLRDKQKECADKGYFSQTSNTQDKRQLSNVSRLLCDAMFKIADSTWFKATSDSLDAAIKDTSQVASGMVKVGKMAQQIRRKSHLVKDGETTKLLQYNTEMLGLLNQGIGGLHQIQVQFTQATAGFYKQEMAEAQMQRDRRHQSEVELRGLTRNSFRWRQNNVPLASSGVEY